MQCRTKGKKQTIKLNVRDQTIKSYIDAKIEETFFVGSRKTEKNTPEENKCEVRKSFEVIKRNSIFTDHKTCGIGRFVQSVREKEPQKERYLADKKMQPLICIRLLFSVCY